MPRLAAFVSTPVLTALFVPLWSTGFVTARLVAPHAEPLTFLFLRFVVAGLLLAAVAVLLRRPWPSTWRDAGQAMAAGVMIHGLYLGCVFFSVARGLPSGISALVAGLQPLLTGFLAGPLLGEPVSGRRWAGIALGAAGAGLTLAPRLGQLGDGGIPLGALGICSIGMIAMTFGTIFQKRSGRSADLLSNTALQYAGAIVPVGLGALVLEQGHFDIAAPAAWIGLTWSILGMSIGAILLLMVLIRRGAVAQVASLLYLVPGVSALMAYGLFGETLTGLQVAGLAVAAVGVAIASRG